MAVDVVVPEVGEVGMDVTFLGWLKAEGDTVRAGEALFELDTAKATIEIEAAVEGVLGDLAAAAGDIVTPHQVIARIVDPGESPAPVEARAADVPGLPGEPAATPAASAATQPGQVGASPPSRAPGAAGASPRARRLAGQHGVDLARIAGTGPDGLVTERDVRAAAGFATGTDVVPAGPGMDPGRRAPAPWPDEIPVETRATVQAIDLTDRIAARTYPDGLLWIACPHTTAALVIGEADEDMLADYERVAATWFASYEPFRHHRNDNPNAAAHLVSSLAGTQLLVPVRDGRLVLGTWQRIVFIELDGPKSRRIQLASIPTLAGPEG